MNTYIPAEEPLIRILGRTHISNPLPLFWTASGVEFTVDGTELYFELETDYEIHEQWIRIEVNGYPMIRTALLKGDNTVCVFRGLEMGVPKKVRFYKEVQPMRADASNCLLLKAIRTDGMLLETEEKKYRIEFVGDSITSGEGMAGTTAMHVWAPTIFSTQGHYALRTGEQLDAEVRLISQSGWGVCSSWDNDPVRTLPPYYEKICGIVKGTKNEKLGAFLENDFTRWKPDVIVVNLGSNDCFAFDNPAWTDEEGRTYQQKRNPDGSFEKESADRFEKAVYDFLVKLRKYNSDSHILWAYGMIDDTMCPYIVNALERYVKDSGDGKAEYLALPVLRPEWKGANDHPGAPSHEAASNVLTERIRALLPKR